MATNVRARTRARRNSLLNGSFAATLLVVLAATALIAQPPSPPAIAEFAPSSQQQIEEAPDEQSAESGQSGASGARETIVVEETEAAKAADSVTQDTITIEGVPSALQCFTWPDGSVTQTFDPQSPPCIATWDQDAGNGGVTSTGVTGTEILFAWPGYTGSDFDNALIEFVNTRYQLYGRRFVAVGTTWSRDPETHLASAEEAMEAKVFAAFDFSSGSPVNGAYTRKLARNRIVTLLSSGTEMSTEEVESFGPMIWSGMPLLHQQWDMTGAFICTSLVGRPARLANDPSLQGLTRKFAIVQVDYGSQQIVDTGHLEDRLTACGAEVSSHVVNGALEDAATRTAMANDLRLTGVTSIIVPGMNGSFQADASNANYRPEWIFDGYGPQAEFLGSEPDQNSFGLFTANKLLPPNFDMSHQAARTVDPSTTSRGIVFPSHRWAYQYIRMLAAGVQLAGPNLTPESFGAGLRNTTFPNPSTGAHPFYQGGIGFKHSRSYLGDTALWWWNTQTTQTYSNRTEPGLPCLIRRGARFNNSNMPADDSEFYIPSSDC